MAKILGNEGLEMTFGERLKELREAAGMTQAAVWEAAKLPRKTYLNYEQGIVEERVPFSAVLAITKVLGVDCTAFAGCEFAAPAPPPPEPTKPAKKRKPSS